MGKKIYIGKEEAHENPINNTRYQELLGLNPTLRMEISKHVGSVLFEEVKELDIDELDDNHGIMSDESILETKKELITELEKLEEITGISEHIIVIMDDCFTNIKLLILLKKIFGKESFKRFVRVVNIDYNNKADESYLEENLAINHSVLILGGSLSDTYSMDDSHYDSYLAKMIQQISDEYAPRFLNNKIMGICFGQQYLANIIGAANKNSSGIIATLKGPAQFAPSSCRIKDLKYVNPVYSDALSGLSNFSKNSRFSSVFTRSGYVSFDLLKSGGELGVVPLIEDETTSGIVGWGSKNGNIFGVQFHPEVSFLEYTFNTKKHLKKIIKHVSSEEEEQLKYIENFNIQPNIQKDIGEAFYTASLLAFVRDIQKTYQNISSTLDDTSEVISVSYDQATQRLMKTITERVDFIMEENVHFGDELVVRNWIDAIDKKGRLLLNYQLDWKVNRGIEEVSYVLGIQSVVELIKEHSGLQTQGNYIVRDLGAGDGSTIKELYSSLRNRDIIFYGTGDYIYFDLFSALKNTKFNTTLPEELLILFVEKVVAEFRALKEGSTIEKIQKALVSVHFSISDTIHNSSMTNKNTLMFESEQELLLSQEIQDHFDIYEKILDELRIYVQENLYTLFSNFFKRIYISKFNDIGIQDPLIARVDFQFAIRSTSHVKGREYMKILAEYFYNFAKPGSIFIDNGIHQSYTSIPRLKELHEVSLDIVGGEFILIYNTKKNYFSSVVITKEMPEGKELIEKHLDSDHIIVPLKEAYRSTFFRLEYFVRNFIISNFKNNIVFWNFNEQITNTLKMIMKELEDGNTEKISQIILDLVNHIAKNYKNHGTVYNEIDISLLDAYTIDGESLYDILLRTVYIPSWMNVYADRDY